jgi:hypothetical protein
MVLRVRNRFLCPLEPMKIAVECSDRLSGATQSTRTIAIDTLLLPREQREVVVHLELPAAGMFDLVARGPGESRAASHAMWIRGSPPENAERDTPFFGATSHATYYEWGFPLRREFGSRLERTIVHWHERPASDFDIRIWVQTRRTLECTRIAPCDYYLRKAYVRHGLRIIALFVDLFSSRVTTTKEVTSYLQTRHSIGTGFRDLGPFGRCGRWRNWGRSMPSTRST